MDIKRIVAHGISGVILFIRTSFGLLITPYNTMRSVSIHSNPLSVSFIGFISTWYFILAKSTVHETLWGILISFVLYFCTIQFFSFLPGEGTRVERLKRYRDTWGLTYIPTLMWFYASFLLFLYLPPPRTQSLPGTALSVLFLAYSLSLLAWKLILVYLSIRFSSRIHLYRVLYYIFLYLAISIPIWILLYNLRIFRVPFV